jgi:hypothetical protein
MTTITTTTMMTTSTIKYKYINDLIQFFFKKKLFSKQSILSLKWVSDKIYNIWFNSWSLKLTLNFGMIF